MARAAEPAGRRPKLAFVISNDFGELSNAMHLVRGTRFEAVFLLSQRLAVLNDGALDVPVVPYRTVEDVIAVVDRERPDAVFLFSGYLYTVNAIFDLEELARLVSALRDRRLPIATTDPFLGVLSTLDDHTFSDAHPRKAWLMEHFGHVARIFQDVPHVDLVETEGIPGPERLAFFNPAVLVTDERLAEMRALLAEGLPVADRPRWVFVLSNEDYGVQLGRVGAGRFEALLRARLVDAAGAGRQPVLVAPDRCVEHFQHAGVETLLLLPFAPFNVFMALLLDAEYAFYWNVFSNSFPVRGINRRPVLFFDRGHMEQAIPALYTAGVARYFAGTEPPCLDLRAPLDVPSLETAWTTLLSAMRVAEARFRSAPPPETLVARLLARR